MSRCRSCQAEIIWAKTPRGKSIPLDAQPTTDGNVMVADGVAHVLAPDQLAVSLDLYSPDERFTSHFASCPFASEHRRPR